jgi:sulfite reductase (NADPH) flavoprotein alpha-component
VTDRVECDVDFDGPAAAWSSAALAAMAGEAGATGPESEADPEPVDPGYGRKNPFPAPLLVNDRLNGPGSAKDTRHVSFSLAGSGLSYEAGDALAVQPVNHPAVVDQVIADWQLNPACLVDFPSGGVGPLHQALLHYYEVRHLLGQPAAAPGDVAALLGSLRRLQPRLYSIASSPKAHPDEVQLCLGVVRYQADGIAHEGVTSTFLADRLALGDTTGVYVQTAKHFRLPADRTKPVIMVGPGTGIAPFRAFLEEREATGSPGKNWLFFGDQRSDTDFLYQDQINGWVQRGVLTRLDTAFSRDQPEKIYVQTRMLEAAAELWQWLEEGAYFYVCGDAGRMARDVDEALHEIIRTEGGLTPEAATAYVAQLKKDKRYARDVY